jgi:hypothetical protein
MPVYTQGFRPHSPGHISVSHERVCFPRRRSAKFKASVSGHFITFQTTNGPQIPISITAVMLAASAATQSSAKTNARPKTVSTKSKSITHLPFSQPRGEPDPRTGQTHATLGTRKCQGRGHNRRERWMRPE